MVRKEFLKAKWDPLFDNKPTSGIPRIRFSENFSKKFLTQGIRILDVGCGIGSYTYVIDGDYCVGIDLDLNGLKTAKKYCTKSEFLVASVLNLPFKDNSFDLIFMWAVLETLPVDTEMQAITEVRRALKLGATFLLSAENNHIVTNIMDPGFYLCGQRHYNAKKLIKLIQQVGFSLKEYTIRGGWNTLLAIPIFYFHKHVLHKKEGRLLKFIYEKSEKELNSKKGGFAITFIAMEKINQLFTR